MLNEGNVMTVCNVSFFGMIVKVETWRIYNPSITWYSRIERLLFAILFSFGFIENRFIHLLIDYQCEKDFVWTNGSITWPELKSTNYYIYNWVVFFSFGSNSHLDYRSELFHFCPLNRREEKNMKKYEIYIQTHVQQPHNGKKMVCSGMKKKKKKKIA